MVTVKSSSSSQLGSINLGSQAGFLSKISAPMTARMMANHDNLIANQLSISKLPQSGNLLSGNLTKVGKQRTKLGDGSTVFQQPGSNAKRSAGSPVTNLASPDGSNIGLGKVAY